MKEEVLHSNETGRHSIEKKLQLTNHMSSHMTQTYHMSVVEDQAQTACFLHSMMPWIREQPLFIQPALIMT